VVTGKLSSCQNAMDFGMDSNLFCSKQWWQRDFFPLSLNNSQWAVKATRNLMLWATTQIGYMGQWLVAGRLAMGA